jgi:SAM-dependent MidA family methyltransferase
MPSVVLPDPSAEELAHSARLTERIRAAIAADGPIDFARFMALALYEPGLGYYSAGAAKLGAAGDFVTAPELGGLFARTLARAVAPVLAGGDFVELGAGTGAFAAAALGELAALGALPARYRIVEVSADLRERQRRRIEAAVPALAARVEWLDAPPGRWRGVLFANEVVDALPVRLFTLADDGLKARAVDVADGRFAFVERSADGALEAAAAHALADVRDALPRPYRGELLPQLPAWFEAVASALEQGLAVFVDYGYPRRELYHPERRDGTLVCHYRHRAHDDPLRLVGLQDITAFVDFTALAEAGHGAGFDVLCYASQAAFLLASGLPALVDAHVGDERMRLALVHEAKRLTLPGDMGERFKVLVFGRGVDARPLPWSAVDRSERL